MVLAALSGMERECIRDRTLEGHESACKRGKFIGGAAVADDAMLSMALHLQRPLCGCSVITTRGEQPPRGPFKVEVASVDDVSAV